MKNNEPQLPQREVEPLRLDALYLSRKVGRRHVLIDRVSLSIQDRDFVAIVGVSGAGKTTLLNALSGFRPANRGNVLIDGTDLYQNYNDYRTEMGHVPQDDIIHQELTVYQEFSFSARLRLHHLARKVRQDLIQAVLFELDLTHRQHALVRTLSGGERKRVSIGVELLTKPRLFFLDEATSGLDPETEKQMMLLLRRLADQGRIVILSTHTTKNVMLCDKVVVLAKGGKLAYYGSPQESLTYFGVQDFDDIYFKIDKERSPLEWQQYYLASDAYRQFVVERQQSLIKQPERRQPLWVPRRAKGSSAWRQFLVLSHRNLMILLQDRVSLALMLLVSPLLGLMDFLMVRRNVFDTTLGDSSQSLILMFLSVLIAVIVGSLSTMREIVKESEIYRRERMIGLKVVPYLFSKVWLCVVLALYQSAVFWTTKIFFVDLPNGDPGTRLAMYFTLFLATLGGMVMGLLVSALSPSQNVAPLLTILFLVPQINFAGAIFPLNGLGTPGLWISETTLTRWSYETMVTLSGLGQAVATDPCWLQPETVRQGWSDAEKAKCQCLGPNLFERCRFPGIRKEYDPAVHQPQPPKPKALGNPPELPTDGFSSAVAGFQDDLKAYQTQIATYRNAMERWQDTFSRWKEKRGKAIASGEAIVERVRRTQGRSFAVDVRRHWQILGGIQLTMLGLLVLVQKRKDVL
ncbi:ATP-binding cassette domain-containing protein [Altericista sp. CCNU0014]|uniref:ATP-binding cassette domain-containing protein n=1 Tax=Altericista sp. CCNU0014 TaxID=3082949 RepID=UPI00384D1CFC